MTLLRIAALMLAMLVPAAAIVAIDWYARRR
jgi:hypothetical protein